MRACRPAIPPLLWLSLSLWLSCALGLELVSTTGYIVEPLIIASAFGITLTALSIISYVRLRVPSIVILICIGATLGILLALGQSLSQLQAEILLEGYSGMVTVRFVSDPTDGDFSDRAESVIETDDGRSIKVMLETSNLEGFICNDRAHCVARFVAPDRGYHKRLWLKGCAGTLKASSIEHAENEFPYSLINTLRHTALEELTNQGASPLVMALSCGWRQELFSTDTYTDFKSVGLAHVVAVSGAHLVIVVALFASVLRVLHIPRRITFAILAAIMASYFLLAGAPISALRATLMTTIGQASLSKRRRPHTLNALALALAFIIVNDPSASVSVSLALSALSTLGIVLFMQLIGSWFKHGDRTNLIGEQAGIALAANVFSMPLSCALFSQLPLVSPLSNIVVAPLFAPCCALSLIAALSSCAINPISPLLIDGAGLLANCLENIASLISLIPHGCIPVSIDTPTALAFSFALGCVLWFAWPSVRKGFIGVAGLLVIVGILSLAIRVPLGDALVVIDVGQGESTLVHSKESSVLIDTGTNDSAVLSALARYGIYDLDAIAITHGDDDHCGSLESIASCLEVGCIILTEPSFVSERATTVELVARARSVSDDVRGIGVGDVITVGSFKLVDIAPETFVEDGGNSDSLCLIVGYDPDDDGLLDSTVLLSGDAEADVLERIAEGGLLADVDVVKAPHHGSANGFTAALLDVLNPQFALISCGENNRYGHPAKETLELLEQSNVTVFRTDLQGDVICSFNPSGIIVTTSR